MKLIIHFHILYIKKCVTYACKKHKNRQCDALKQKQFKIKIADFVYQFQSITLYYIRNICLKIKINTF